MTDQPPDIAWLLASLGYLLSLWLLIEKLRNHNRPLKHEQPFIVKPQVEYVEYEEFTALKTDMDIRFKAASDARKGIHEKIDRQNERLARIEAQNDEQTKHLYSMDAKIDRLVERLLGTPK